MSRPFDSRREASRRVVSTRGGGRWSFFRSRDAAVDLRLEEGRETKLALGRLDEERRRARGRLGRVERVEHVVLVAPEERPPGFFDLQAAGISCLQQCFVFSQRQRPFRRRVLVADHLPAHLRGAFP